MTDIRELLNDIEVQVDHHPWVDGQWHVHEAAHGLLAALRAALDLHKMLPRPAWTGDPDDWCSQCDGQAYPCETVRAITEALGGGA